MLPLQYRDSAAVEQIGERIGIVLRLDIGFATKGIMHRKYRRVKVEVSLKNPLMRGLCLEIKENTSLWIPFQYERLPSFCYYYSQIDHEEMACSTKAKNRRE
ncbi:hypothetical protein Syun_019471 [Stephania yunnanensis]|uniref:Zinc knuckle CX2CX4HX4C domain-containing protein n=1 Tax=Stephania yunnanensis TaxID=152371 RepID=A0AAP0NXG2_9MAGN